MARPPASPDSPPSPDSPRAPLPPRLIACGDNLTLLRARVADASVDLVYLDPPFNSNRSYSAVFRGGAVGDDRPTAAGFDDAFRWGPEAERGLAELGEGDDRARCFLEAMMTLLGPGDLLAYLVMMAPRLRELRRVLRPTGSLYLHCDPGASHHLKLLLDAIFGRGCFRNEIVWRYRRWPAQARRFQRMHDVLLFYTRSPGNDHTFHALYGYEKLADSTLKTFGERRQVADFSSGRRKPGLTDEPTKGPPLSDVWEVGVLAPSGKERVGWPTQKPEALLERVVLASSEPGDLVLDPFCGSGTTLAVAERLGRRFAGLDASPLAVGLAKARLERAFPGLDLRVEGEAIPAALGPAKARPQAPGAAAAGGYAGRSPPPGSSR